MWIFQECVNFPYQLLDSTLLVLKYLEFCNKKQTQNTNSCVKTQTLVRNGILYFADKKSEYFAE